MVTVPRLVTVAAGVFAPGHLGELTRYLPFELVDDVLETAGAAQRRMRMLPSRVGVYFLQAMTLFPGLGYLRVWDKLFCRAGGPAPARAMVGELRELEPLTSCSQRWWPRPEELRVPRSRAVLVSLASPTRVSGCL